MTRYEELEAELDGVIDAAIDYYAEAERGPVSIEFATFTRKRKQFLDLLKISLIDSTD